MSTSVTSVTADTSAAPVSPAFVRTADAAWDPMAPGVRRQILGHGPDLMMVRVDFEQGGVGAMHQHPHRQVSYVASGRFAVTVDGEQQELGPGDCFFAVGDVPHAVVALEAGTLIDAFTPTRAEFLAARG